jgi:signal transduction histidine kinase
MRKCALTLYKVYKNKKDFDTALEYHELYQSLSDTLSRNEKNKSFTMLKTKIEHEKQKENLINQNKMALAKQKNYVNAALCILLVFLVVTFLMRRSERIQKKLNIELYNKTTELVKNEQELRDINETKDKLFSIIGHDLRGPIGAFQGLVKLYRDKEIGKEEFLDFIPKLGADIDHISFTLNNLLSWGQTQMNGSVTKPTIVSLENIVDDNINLLTEIATSKSISLVNKLPENTLVWSDSNQIDIVLRNLMSNALKFTPNKGLITINAVERANNWEISVRDTGVGMDREALDKVFSDNANITTYGTNNEKGTGLGLSLCKEMVEKNGGTIWVESILNRGTSFYFTVPRAKPPKNYQQAS